ncbi:MAG: VOC family protein [Polyangiales bacterium]
MRIRQIALVARELEPVVAELRAALDLEVCYRDQGVGAFGLHNALLAIGDTFLEVVSPVREGTTAGRLLHRRGGDGGYMVILQTDDLGADRARLGSLGVRVVWEVTLPDIASVHLHPKDVGGAIVSLDQPQPPGSWRWGGPSWAQQRPSELAATITCAELQAAEPAAMAARWAAVLGLSAAALPDGSHTIELVGGRLRFVAATDGRGDGLAGFELAARPGVSPRKLSICGTRIRLR